MTIDNVVIAVFGARSLSCHFACSDGDTLAFTTLRDALAKAGAVPSLDIMQFLSTTHGDADGTVIAIAQAGAIIDPIGADGPIPRSIAGDNLLRFHAASSRVALRISLSSALSS